MPMKQRITGIIRTIPVTIADLAAYWKISELREVLDRCGCGELLEDEPIEPSTGSENRGDVS